VSRTATEPTGLAAAAAALEEELRRFEQLADGIQHERLDSEKHLRRAAQTLHALRDSEARLAQNLAALVAAIGEAQTRQQAQAGAVQQRADRIRERSEALARLVGRWEALGRDAAEVTQLVQNAAEERSDGNGSDRRPDPTATFEAVDERLTRLADEAQALGESATAEEFADLARQADALRAQVLGARNRLRLARGAA